MKAEFVAKDLPRLELDTVWPWARREGCRAGRHLTRFVAGTCVLEAMMRCGGGKVEGHEGMAGLLPMPSAQLTSPDIFRPADLGPSRSCARQPQSLCLETASTCNEKTRLRHGTAKIISCPVHRKNFTTWWLRRCTCSPNASVSRQVTTLYSTSSGACEQAGACLIHIRGLCIWPYMYSQYTHTFPLIFRTTATQHLEQATAS